MNIGSIILKGAALAPMAGVGDRAFREICIKHGAGYVVGEMASSKGLMFSDRKTAELLEVTQGQRPMAVQLFGDDPVIMAQAAVKSLEFGPDIIDINMGCPAPKIAGNGGGSALMKSPELAQAITEQVVKAVNIPVTVKFRKGWDDSSVNAVDFAKRMEQAGAAAVAVHGRTRMQMYSPPVDIDIIKAVKEAVSIPVIGNGDVVDIQSAVEMLSHTGCDMLMIGRGALGSPWIFNELNHFFATGEILPPPTIEEKMAVMVEHMELACRYKGQRIALREGRKHTSWYMKGLKGAAAFRRSFGQIVTMDDVRALAEDVIALNNSDLPK